MRTLLNSTSALAGLAALGILAAGATTPAVADDQDCPQGNLDAGFCDTDGDLLADTPESADEWLDPDTLVFTYTPVEDPALYEGVWAEFIDHLAETTGRDVRYFTVNSYAAMVEAMRAGRLHVGGFATGSVPLGVNCAGLHPFTTMGVDDEITGYEMELITYPGSGIEEVGDVEGRTITFASETSNSGFRAPNAILSADFGLVRGENFDYNFSGAHDQSILGVANQDYEVAAIANSVLERMIDRDVISEDEYVTIYQSETFPTTAYGYVYNLHPDLQEQVREAFFSFDWDGTGLQDEFGEQANMFVPISYEVEWEIIRTIANEIGETLECG